MTSIQSMRGCNCCPPAGCRWATAPWPAGMPSSNHDCTAIAVAAAEHDHRHQVMPSKSLMPTRSPAIVSPIHHGRSGSRDALCPRGCRWRAAVRMQAMASRRRCARDRRSRRRCGFAACAAGLPSRAAPWSDTYLSMHKRLQAAIQSSFLVV